MIPKFKFILEVIFVMFTQHFAISFIGFCMIAGVLFWPTIFIKIIIPRIERQVGSRLEFYIPSWSRTPTFIRKTSEISFYIIAKYLVRKFTGKSSEEFKLSSSYALQRVNYRVEDAPKFFIFMSFVTWLGCIWFLVGGALMYFKIIT